MAYRILVPLDGSVLADRAIPWADELAGALGAEVTLFRIVPPSAVPMVNADQAEGWLVDAEALLARRALVRAGARFHYARPTDPVVLHGPPGEFIAAHARASFDLVVMASHGRSGVARAVLGSVAATVVREAGVPVFVIPQKTTARPRVPRRVLVPLDGSDFAASILPYICPLARRLGWELRLLGVLPLERMSVDAWSDLQMYLEARASQLRHEGFAVKAEWDIGPAGGAVLEWALRLQADLIAMSTHGRRGIDRWISGSITEYVLGHAAQPLLAVHPLPIPSNGACGPGHGGGWGSGVRGWRGRSLPPTPNP